MRGFASILIDTSSSGLDMIVTQDIGMSQPEPTIKIADQKVNSLGSKTPGCAASWRPKSVVNTDLFSAKKL